MQISDWYELLWDICSISGRHEWTKFGFCIKVFCLTLLVCLTALKIFWRLYSGKVSLTSIKQPGSLKVEWDTNLDSVYKNFKLRQEWTVEWELISLWNSCLSYVAELMVILEAEQTHQNWIRSAQRG